MKVQEDYATHTLCCCCFERYPRFDVVELSCKREDEDLLHAYCRDCINGLFEACVRDTTLWPPRCCGARISVYAAAYLLDPKLVTQCETKDKELSTSNPTYCSNRSCAEWIPPSNIKAAVGKCYNCSAETCTTCKNPKHKGLCPEDEDVQQLMKYAGEQKYKRCFRCRTLVELEIGCNHMRCSCGAEFCYLCGEPWKTCSCDSFIEGRLFRGHATQTPGSPIPMPEKDELPEPDPMEDVISGLQLRLASFVEASTNIVSANVATCSHNWVRCAFPLGEKEGCNICYEAVSAINKCSQCGVSLCTVCLNNRL
ncbi:hypothetical protein DM02DRAFT_559460 [Periconia macrospinosa]|uniref:RBR-type E3 ubiquitin transferase n=1 Tax=Periconia macrospinosa TaxID=97972 RepID=A0A2V1DWZ5_9PLEO|nr:hypothetical protein DM02DRAFT_559460 [Periconia macrospinosa]